MLLISLVTVLCINIISSQLINDCIFMDKNNSEWSLDLSHIMNETIIGYSSDNSTFYYSPCSNKFQCSNASSAIIKNANGSCVSLAVWTKQTIPTFNMNQQMWSFNYTNININWICNSSIKHWKVTSADYYTNNYAMDIESEYGCLSCIFQQNNEILNLTDLKGVNMTFVSSSQLIWSYEPCWNFTDEAAMIVGYVNQNTLLNRFAVWNGDFDLKIGELETMNGTKRYWQFDVYNYGICETDSYSPPQNYIAVIKWICNEHIHTFQFTQVVWDPMVECQLYMDIESKYACTTSHNEH